MTERDTFLRAILDAPADDTARLVFADWLDETGKPRDAAHAELIRLQVARAAAPADFAPREAALLKKWGARWLPRTARDDLSFRRWEVRFDSFLFHGSIISSRYVFARGFLAHVELLSELGPPRGEETGAFLAEALAHRPVSSARIQVAGMAPVLELEFGPLPSRTRHDWGAKLTSVYEDDRERPVTELVCSSRAGLLAALPGWFDEELDEVGFEVMPDEIPF